MQLWFSLENGGYGGVEWRRAVKGKSTGDINIWNHVNVFLLFKEDKVELQFLGISGSNIEIPANRTLT